MSVQASFRFVKRLTGHASYITALDWSLDGRLLQSTDGGYELLYWDVAVRDTAHNAVARAGCATCLALVVGVASRVDIALSISTVCVCVCVQQGKLAQTKHAKPFGDVRWFVVTTTCTGLIIAIAST